MRYDAKDDAVPFRVALILKRYKFGSNIAARYLGKPRGLVQSWMRAGESHALAESKFRLRAFEKKLKNIRQRITRENMYYLLAMRLMELDIPPEYVGRHLGLPQSTVRSWKEGVIPKGVKRVFIDRDLIEREFTNVLQFLSHKSTRENMQYYLSLKLSEMGRQNVGRRRIGGKTISRILTRHFNLTRRIPKETITCWIDGKRRPKTAFEALKDTELIEKEYRMIVDELTDEHMDYHVAKALYEDHLWTYSKISKTLGLDKEKVRGWVKKDRGNPVAKCFRNQDKIEEAVKTYLDGELDEALNGESDETLNGDLEGDLEETVIGEDVIESLGNALVPPEAIEDDFDYELEDEILYHLGFFPLGLSSPEAILSILIDKKDTMIEDIEDVLNNSKRIVRKGGRWVLRE